MTLDTDEIRARRQLHCQDPAISSYLDSTQHWPDVRREKLTVNSTAVEKLRLRSEPTLPVKRVMAFYNAVRGVTEQTACTGSREKPLRQSSGISLVVQSSYFIG